MAKGSALKGLRKFLCALLVAMVINMTPATILAGEYSPALARVMDRPAWVF